MINYIFKMFDFNSFIVPFIFAFPIFAGFSHLSYVCAILSLCLNIIGCVLIILSYEGKLPLLLPIFYKDDNNLSYFIRFFYMFNSYLLILSLFTTTSVSFIYTFTYNKELYISNTVLSSFISIAMLINVFIYYIYIKDNL